MVFAGTAVLSLADLHRATDVSGRADPKPRRTRKGTCLEALLKLGEAVADRGVGGAAEEDEDEREGEDAGPRPRPPVGRHDGPTTDGSKKRSVWRGGMKASASRPQENTQMGPTRKGRNK